MKGKTSTANERSMSFLAASGRFCRQPRQSTRASSSAPVRSDQEAQEESQNHDGDRFQASRDSRNFLIAVLQEALDIVSDEGDDLIEADDNGTNFYMSPHPKHQE